MGDVVGIKSPNLPLFPFVYKQSTRKECMVLLPEVGQVGTLAIHKETQVLTQFMFL